MSSPDVEVVASHDPAWDGLLEAVADDVYHRAGYHRFAEETEHAKAFLAVIRESRGRRGLLWPYLLRPTADIPELADAGSSDVDSVYGYPGPLAWGCRPDEPFIQEAVRALVGVWRSQGAVSAFTRFHPVLGNVLFGANLPAPGPAGSDAIVLIGETVAIDLRLDDATAVAGYSKTLRQEIASARRAGITTRLDEDWSTLDTFGDLYRETMIRAGATITYFFSNDDLRRLKVALGAELHLFVAEMDGRIASACLFTEHRSIVQAHLVGSNDEFRAWSPFKLLLDDVRGWSRRRGNEVLHLGGGRGGRDDSLLAFKRRFSPRRHRFSIGRWVLDPAAYTRLTSEHSTRIKAAGRVITDPTYFPAYRSSLHAPELAFRVVSSADQEALVQVFAEIDDTFFSPHPFTAEEARRLANYSGRDLYALLADGRGPVAYGMLRGWAQGYTTPSLGVAVRTSAQGRGFGREMMTCLHAEARRRGADYVRLRVHRDNVAARRLYESLGYVYSGEDRGELVMFLDIRAQRSPTALT